MTPGCHAAGVALGLGNGVVTDDAVFHGVLVTKITMSPSALPGVLQSRV
jgi:uncharacterized membrane protein